MKLFVFFLIIAIATAFAPVQNNQHRINSVSLNAIEPQSRKMFLAKAAAASASLVLVSAGSSSPAFAAKQKDEYSLDTGSVVVEKKEKSKASEGSSNLVIGGLAGSVLLSLPFFLPNVLRLLGIKQAKKQE